MFECRNLHKDHQPSDSDDDGMEAIRGMQDYKLKRHSSSKGGWKSVGSLIPGYRQTKLPELLRLQMGQANLHVAKVNVELNLSQSGDSMCKFERGLLCAACSL